MKEINWDELGGNPFTQEDLKFSQESFIEALINVAKSGDQTGATSVIISGCEITTSGGNVSIAEGWVLHNDKICYFSGDTYTDAFEANKPVFTYSYNVVPNSSETYENGVSHDTRYRHVVTLDFSGSTDGNNIIRSLRLKKNLSWYHKNVIRNAWSHRMDDFTALSVSSGVTTPATANQFDAEYHLDGNLFLKLRGSFSVSNTFNASTTEVFEIPGLITPSKEIILTGVCRDEPKLDLTVFTDGKVYITNHGGSLSGFASTLNFSLESTPYIKLD